MTQWARDPNAYDNGKADFDEFFQKYYFPAMTRDTPNGLAELGKLRTDLVKKLLWDSSNDALKRDLTNMAFKAMGRIVLSSEPPPYHPAVRYNAILVIGLLDEQYAIEGGAGARPPKPLPAANTALTKIVGGSATSDRFPAPVVLGALIGLERHAKYATSLPPQSVAAMSAALLKFVNQDKSAHKLDPDAHAWLRLRAASALANLGTVGDKNAVHDAFVNLIGNAKSLDDRCLAAAYLGRLNYNPDKDDATQDVKIDAAAAKSALFELAKDLSADELERADDFEKMGSTGSYASPERMLGGTTDDEPYDPYPRRHVLARLVNLRTGLNAVKPAVPEETQKEIDALLVVVKPVIDAAANTKDVISLRVAQLVRSMHGQITDLVGEDAAEAAEAEDEFAAGAEAPAPAQPAAEEPAGTQPPAEQPAAAPAEPPADETK
jgi:hypothetical protein